MSLRKVIMQRVSFVSPYLRRLYYTHIEQLTSRGTSAASCEV